MPIETTSNLVIRHALYGVHDLFADMDFPIDCYKGNANCSTPLYLLTEH